MRKKRLALIGTTVFSQQIKGFAELTGNFEVVCYYNDLVEYGTPIGDDGLICRGAVANCLVDYQNDVFDEAFICVGYTRFDLRESFYNLLKGKVPLATIIHPEAIVDKTAVIGEGVYVGWRTLIDCHSVIEDNVVLLNDFISHNNIIRKHTYVAGGSRTTGFVEIGQRCFIGSSCLFADHLTVCDDVWLSIGSIVTTNIKKPGKYVSAAIKLVNIG